MPSPAGRPLPVRSVYFRLIVGAVALTLTLSFPVPARETSALSRMEINPDPEAEHPFCASHLAVRNRGLVETTSSTPPSDEFSIRGELWVGAEFDPGTGTEVQVSTLNDFSPIEHWSMPLEFAYADTGEGLVAHTPLGIRVREHTRGVTVDTGGRVVIRFIVSNISGEWQAPGWDLNHVYLGMYADVDVGMELPDDQDYWTDDQVAFISSPNGDAGYIWDQNGGEDSEDDVSARVGILLFGQETHAFQSAGWGQYPPTESDTYALLRGDSHDVQTIDAPSIRPSDCRMLLSAGPFHIPRGESRVLYVAYLCDASRPLRPSPYEIASTRETSSFRLSGGTIFFARPGEILFRSLPPGARIGIYSVTGRHLADVDTHGASEARWEWAMDTPNAGGIYFYRLNVPGEEARTGKIILVR